MEKTKEKKPFKQRVKEFYKKHEAGIIVGSLGAMACGVVALINKASYDSGYYKGYKDVWNIDLGYYESDTPDDSGKMNEGHLHVGDIIANYAAGRIFTHFEFGTPDKIEKKDS